MNPSASISHRTFSLDDLHPDLIENGVHIFLHVFVPNSYDADSRGFDLLLPTSIFVQRTWPVVADAIDLDREPQLRAVEVRDIFEDAMLTPEFHPFDLATLDAQPEECFGSRAMNSQVLADRLLMLPVENDSHAGPL